MSVWTNALKQWFHFYSPFKRYQFIENSIIFSSIYSCHCFCWNCDCLFLNSRLSPKYLYKKSIFLWNQLSTFEVHMHSSHNFYLSLSKYDRIVKVCLKSETASEVKNRSNNINEMRIFCCCCLKKCTMFHPQCALYWIEFQCFSLLPPSVPFV